MIITLVCCISGLIATVSAGGYVHAGDIAYNYQTEYAPAYDNYKPKDYKFEYAVSDPHTGDHKSQWEVKENGVVRGAYSLLEPDGTTRVVEYIADDDGFRAVVKKIGESIHDQGHYDYQHLRPLYDDHSGVYSGQYENYVQGLHAGLQAPVVAVQHVEPVHYKAAPAIAIQSVDHVGVHAVPDVKVQPISAAAFQSEYAHHLQSLGHANVQALPTKEPFIIKAEEIETPHIQPVDYSQLAEHYAKQAHQQVAFAEAPHIAQVQYAQPAVAVTKQFLQPTVVKSYQPTVAVAQGYVQEPVVAVAKEYVQQPAVAIAKQYVQQPAVAIAKEYLQQPEISFSKGYIQQVQQPQIAIAKQYVQPSIAIAKEYVQPQPHYLQQPIISVEKSAAKSYQNSLIHHKQSTPIAVAQPNPIYHQETLLGTPQYAAYGYPYQYNSVGHIAQPALQVNHAAPIGVASVQVEKPIVRYESHGTGNIEDDSSYTNFAGKINGGGLYFDQKLNYENGIPGWYAPQQFVSAPYKVLKDYQKVGIANQYQGYNNHY